MLYENWKSPAELDAHFALPYMQRVVAGLGELLDGALEPAAVRDGLKARDLALQKRRVNVTASSGVRNVQAYLKRRCGVILRCATG